MTWAQRLKRVFDIDIEICASCGGKVKVIACIENPEVIRIILAHLCQFVTGSNKYTLPEGCSPPQRSLFAE